MRLYLSYDDSKGNGYMTFVKVRTLRRSDNSYFRTIRGKKILFDKAY